MFRYKLRSIACIALSICVACSGKSTENVTHPVNPEILTAIPTATSTPTATPVPTQRPTPTSTPTASNTPVPTATPTVDFTKYVNSWISYHNDEYGFSFDYPAVFADPAWRSCNVSAKPGVSIGSTLVTVGWQGTLVISHADGVTADEFIDGRLKANASDNNFRSGPKVKQIVAGVSAVNIEYQFGGLGRYGTATALVHNGHLFLFNYEAGADCSIPEANMDGFMAYLHMIETFKFDK